MANSKIMVPSGNKVRTMNYTAVGTYGFDMSDIKYLYCNLEFNNQLLNSFMIPVSCIDPYPYFISFNAGTERHIIFKLYPLTNQIEIAEITNANSLIVYGIS